jgi:hypothetical protein
MTTIREAGAVTATSRKLLAVEVLTGDPAKALGLTVSVTPWQRYVAAPSICSASSGGSGATPASLRAAELLDGPIFSRVCSRM